MQQFFVKSPWQASDLRQRRIELLRVVLGNRQWVLVIDETSDRKKEQTTDYVKRQYIGNLGKIENGLVSIDVYGVIDNVTVLFTFMIYKPKARLKVGDTHRTKLEIAAKIVQELCLLSRVIEER